MENLINSVFSRPPGEPNSVQLELDTEPLPGETEEFTLFKALIEIMVQGINKLFGTGAGNKINISDITPQQLKKVNEYMNSIGWEIVLEQAKNKQLFRINMKNIVSGDILPDYLQINQSR